MMNLTHYELDGTGETSLASAQLSKTRDPKTIQSSQRYACLLRVYRIEFAAMEATC